MLLSLIESTFVGEKKNKNIYYYTYKNKQKIIIIKKYKDYDNIIC